MRKTEAWFADLIARRTGWRPDSVFSFNGGAPESVRIVPPNQEFDAAGADLPGLLGGGVLDGAGNLIFDLPGLAAWSLGRFEERDAPGWSVKDKFRFARSLAASQGVGDRPFVDLLVDRFCEGVLQLRANRGLRTPAIRRPWPGGKRAAVCFTHDVDQLDGQTHLWARRAFWRAKRLACDIRGDRATRADVEGRLRRWRRDGSDPAWTIPRWIELEKKRGIRSTVYFFALATGLGPEGRLYHYRHHRMIEAVGRLTDAGFEVGLHPGSHGAGSLRMLRAQRDRIDRVCPGAVSAVRNHRLNVRFPHTWDLAGRAGFATMSNVGWDGGDNGFRAGTCFPYRPSDIPGIGVGDRLVEVPFQLMDASRIQNVESYVEKALHLLKRTREAGGVFVLDFHPHNMDPVEAPGVHEAFGRICDAVLSDSDLWIAPVSEVAGALYPKDPRCELLLGCHGQANAWP